MHFETDLWIGVDALQVAGVRGRIETKSVLHRVALTINRCLVCNHFLLQRRVFN